MNSVTILDTKAQTYLDTMIDPLVPSTTELWEDKAFADAEMGAKVTESLDRLKLIAIQYCSPYSKHYHNEEVKQQIMNALNFILANKYGPSKPASTPSNWWDWQIGAPKSLVDLAILFDSELPKEVKSDITKTIDRFVPKANYRLNSSLVETGANLIDKIAIVIKRAALDENEERLQHAKECIAPLFSYSSTGDGYYPDGSFIQHGNIPYNGSYGYVLLNELANSIIMLNLTENPLDEEQIKFFEDKLLRHYIPFISYGGNVVDSVRGRAVSRKVQQGDTMGMQMMGVLLQYADTGASKETKEAIYHQLKGIINEKFNEKQTQDFSVLAYSDYLRVMNLKENDEITAQQRNTFQVYSYMDRIVSNREGYTFTLAANSNRMCTEQGNSENLLGRYQGQGYTQIYNNDISQYNKDYNATVDQYRLSGVTTAHQDLGFNTPGQSKWSGGTTLDGINGTSGFILTGDKQLTYLSGGFGSENNTGVTSGITARKSYFVFGDRIVYLGSDINNLNTDPEVDYVETIVENRKTIEGMQLSVDGQTVVNENGTMTITNPKTAYLSGKTSENGLGYIFLEDAQLDVKKETRSGTWNDVNKIAKFTDYTPVSNDYISMAVNHGQTPQNATYSYVILPHASEKEVIAYQNNPTIQVLSNTIEVHAVQDMVTGQTAFNFFEAGHVQDVTVDKPVSIVMDKKENSESFAFAISDPTRTLTEATVTIQNVNTNHLGVLSENAKVINKEGNSITLKVTFTSKDGQPVKVSLGTIFESQSVNYADVKNGATEATASSVVQNSATAQRLPKFANDGNSTTRWASAYTTGQSIPEENDEWLAIDLGMEREISQANISWEAAKAKEYKLLGSLDGENYFELYHFKEGDSAKVGRNDKLTFNPTKVRYVKMQGIERNQLNGIYYGGYSIYELEVYNKVSLTDSLETAQMLLERYDDVKAFASETVYNTVKTDLLNAIQAAEDLMDQGAAYNDEDLTRITNELDIASRKFDQAVKHVEEIIITSDNITLSKNEGKQLHVEIHPSDAFIQDVRWESDDKNIVKVDENGYIQAVGTGVTKIRAIALDNQMSDEIEVTVDTKVTGIQLNKTSVIINRNESEILKAEVQPADALNQKVLWSSSNEDVATVDENGNVTAHKVGSAIISATTVDGNYTATCSVQVDAQITSENLMIGATASASSTVAANGVTPQGAVDQNYSTRWASNYKNISVEEAEEQWLVAELPEARTMNQIKLTWFSETIYGKEYKILGSVDGVNYEEMVHITDGKNKTVTLNFDDTTVKYVKFQGIKRTGTTGGYGIVEFEAYYNMKLNETLTEARELLNKYPTDIVSSLKEYQDLVDAIHRVDELVEGNDYSDAELKEALDTLKQAMDNFVAVIVEVEDIEVVASINLKLNQNYQITAEFKPADATDKRLIFESRNPEIVMVDQNGNVKAISSGTTVITVKTYNGKISKEIDVTVATNTKPYIKANDVVIEEGSMFNPLDYASASDKEDGVLTLTNENIKFNNVNVKQPGIYQVTYIVQDSDGNVVEKTINVEVKEMYKVTSITTPEGITVRGLFVSTDKVNSYDITDQCKDFDDQKVLIAYSIHVEHDITGLPVYEIRIPFTESTEGLGVYRLNESYQPIEFIVEENEIVIKTSIFGNFVLTQKVEEETEKPTNPDQPGDSADTSDSSHVVFSTYAVVISGVTIAYLANKKRKENM